MYNRAASKIKRRYYIEILKPETITWKCYKYDN